MTKRTSPSEQFFELHSQSLRPLIVRSWFSAKWFIPTYEEALRFSSFLTNFAMHNIFHKDPAHPLPNWMGAVQVIRDEMPAVLKDALEYEKATNNEGGIESSAFADLLRAAAAVRIWTPPYESASLNDGKGDHAAAIANYVNDMAVRAGVQPRTANSPESLLAKITSNALLACGFKGAINPGAIAKDFKRKGLHLDRRRKRGEPKTDNQPAG